MRYLKKEAAVIMISLLFGAVSCSSETSKAEATVEPVQDFVHSTEGPTAVTVNSIRPFEEADGYTYIEATMRGTVERDDGPEGKYSVPFILIYPDDGGNGVGVVDWVNTVSLSLGGFTASADEWEPGQYALITTGGFLFESGFTYAGVQWDKAVTDYFGASAPDGGEGHSHLIYGTIEQAEDSFEILRDIVHFLRDPNTLDGADDLKPADAVLSFGFSQTGMLQMEFLSQGKNVRDGELVYDGHLFGKAGLICVTFHNEPPAYAEFEPCEEPPAEDGSKAIHVAAQGDVEALLHAGHSRFPDNPDWRQYELAGVSHLPVPIAPGLDENQNPVSSKPVFRAAFHNLARWVTEGIPAPPSRFLEGTLNEDGTFATNLDEDSNALGGLRLPHMEQAIDGTVVGAPLGRYTGKHPEADPEAELLRWIGGYFEPFSDEEIAAHYPGHETYVERVTRAADYLLEAGYILEEGRDAYVREAQNSSIGKD